MELIDILKTFLFYGIILVSFLLSWKIGYMVLKDKGIGLAIIYTFLSSALLLASVGYYWYNTEPDQIGKGISVFIYFISFIMINLINTIRLYFSRRKNL
jgi:hypothetical protein